MLNEDIPQPEGEKLRHTETVPVLISGSGPVGLTLSILLSRQGIRNIVVEKRAKINELPRARGITVRSVEILSQLGLREELEESSLPQAWLDHFVYTNTICGDLLGKMPSDAMQPGSADKVSPARYLVAAQDRIDPILFHAAESYDEAEIRFETECLYHAEDEDGVVATLRKPNGTLSRVRSQFLIAADGGKSPLRQAAGIGETGRANLRSFINNHIRADFSAFTQGREGALMWVLKPGLQGLFQPLDGKEKWAIQVQYDPEDPEKGLWTEEKALAKIRAMIDHPDADQVPITILKSYSYTISMMIADRFRQGRLLLVGDAAHQIPPYGGFGLNTGIQSAHNLAWKLGAVLRGEAGDALLDTYDSERREVARRVCEFGRINAGYIEQLMRAVVQANSAEEKGRILSSSRQYGNWWGLDLGVHYEGEGAYVADDVAQPPVEDPVIDFVPHAKPGHRAPHFWAQRDGERISSIAMFDRDFVLLAGPDGQAWVDALGAVSLDNAPAMRGYRVAADGDLVPEGDVCALYGIEADGAVLVRPDGHVAWRSPTMADAPAEQIAEVLAKVLRREGAPSVTETTTIDAAA